MTDPGAGPSGITHRDVNVRGLRMHLAEAGSGPLVLLLHGFPESWYSWRHQLTALAAAGFRAVAPDQRGYCGTDAPASVDAYTILHLAGDVIGLMDVLGERQAVVAGHDWGAPVAWHTALLRERASCCRECASTSRGCAIRCCSPAAVTGPSRNAPPRSAMP